MCGRNAFSLNEIINKPYIMLSCALLAVAKVWCSTLNKPFDIIIIYYFSSFYYPFGPSEKLMWNTRKNPISFIVTCRVLEVKPTLMDTRWSIYCSTNISKETWWKQKRFFFFSLFIGIALFILTYDFLHLKLNSVNLNPKNSDWHSH